MSEVLVSRPPASVLVVDDQAANRDLLVDLLARIGLDAREASDGLEALAEIERDEPDLILLDIDMPHLDGISVCVRLKADERKRLIPVVIITAHDDNATKLRGIAAGADGFLNKPFDRRELTERTKVLLRERMRNKRLDGAETVIRTLAGVIESRDLYTVHHAERVGHYSRAIGESLGFSNPEDLDVLYSGGVLHDLGKAFIPIEILLKSGALSDVEWAIMRSHPERGEGICVPLRSTVAYLPLIRHHHERWDGSGYPDHLLGAAIPLSARIAAVADGWDAMSSDRPYRMGLDREEALRRLREGAGTQWDPEAVSHFVALVDGGLVERVDPLANGA